MLGQDTTWQPVIARRNDVAISSLQGRTTWQSHHRKEEQRGNPSLQGRTTWQPVIARRNDVAISLLQGRTTNQPVIASDSVAIS